MHSQLRFAASVAETRRKTRFRPLARLYRVGLFTHRVPAKGFRGVIVTSLSPFPKLAWRNNRSPFLFTVPFALLSVRPPRGLSPLHLQPRIVGKVWHRCRDFPGSR